MATSSSLFLATIYNQSQLAERKHVARHWSIITAATAVSLSAHPSPLVITTKLAAAILGGGCSEEVFCWPSTAPVVVIPMDSTAFHGMDKLVLRITMCQWDVSLKHHSLTHSACMLRFMFTCFYLSDCIVCVPSGPGGLK